jgi:hypothetical protein
MQSVGTQLTFRRRILPVSSGSGNKPNKKPAWSKCQSEHGFIQVSCLTSPPWRWRRHVPPRPLLILTDYTALYPRRLLNSLWSKYVYVFKIRHLVKLILSVIQNLLHFTLEWNMFSPFRAQILAIFQLFRRYYANLNFFKFVDHLNCRTLAWNVDPRMSQPEEELKILKF